MRLPIPHSAGETIMTVSVYESAEPPSAAERFLARCRFPNGERSPVFHTAETRELLVAQVEDFYRDQFDKALKKSQGVEARMAKARAARGKKKAAMGRKPDPETTVPDDEPPEAF